jgi:hypothetical protein
MWRVFLLLFLSLAAMAVPAWAYERILSWHSHLVVEKGGDLVVTETIRVRAEGKEIKRGIFRRQGGRHGGVAGGIQGDQGLGLHRERRCHG